MAQFKFEAIGTTWNIDTYEKSRPENNSTLLSKIKTRIDIFDLAYSRFRADSLVTKMSKNIGVYELPSDAKSMLDLYRDLYLRTNGLVTPLIGNLISDAGYDSRYSLKPKDNLHTPPTWEDALEYEHPRLVVKKPILLDFGAAGKGYLVDIIGKLLEDEGILEYCIDAGGDILHKGKASIRVGLEDPGHKDRVVGVSLLGDGSICGSAGNRRKWDRFTHILNPKTLTSPTDIIAVWVVAKTALVADGLATCLFFVEAKQLLGGYDFEYVIVREDRSIEKSANFSGEIFTRRE